MAQAYSDPKRENDPHALPSESETRIECGCEHPKMADPTGPNAGTCEECGAACSGRDDDESGTCQDSACPIHGSE